MEKQTFEKGDRVDFDRYEDISFRYRFDGRCSSNSALKRLSFTEYTLQGFSQEKPINYEEYVGKWGKFWTVIKDVGIQNTVIGHLSDYNENDIEGFPFACEETGGYYTNFEPLTEKQIKILEL